MPVSQIRRMQCGAALSLAVILLALTICGCTTGDEEGGGDERAKNSRSFSGPKVRSQNMRERHTPALRRLHSMRHTLQDEGTALESDAPRELREISPELIAQRGLHTGVFGGGSRAGFMSKCNVTAPCEQCSEQSMQDQAEYCMSTGWRKVITCVQSPSHRRETHFVTCEAGQETARGPWAVAQMELCMVVMLTVAMYYIKHRKRVMDPNSKNVGTRSYIPLTPV